ncbi:MAG: glycosyltransferase family 4 protein [Planctomycetaceae bacterium]
MQSILFITENFPPSIGGVAISSDRIARTLVASGHSADVFVLSRDLPSGAAKTEEPTPGLRVHRLGLAKSDDFSMQQAMNFLDWLHGRRGFSLVWGHYATQPGFLATWFAENNQLKSILSVRGNDLDRQVFPPGDFARIQWCLERATEVVAVSEDLAGKIRTLSQREPFVLKNVVDAELFVPGPRPDDLVKKYGIRSDEIVVVFSGELRAKKGTPFLLRAFDEIRKRRPARLMILGAVRSADRGDFERLTVSIGDARKDIIQTGHIDDRVEVAKHLKLGDVFLLPSLWDGMPNSLLEAMAAGIPVVASNAGAIPEVVEDGVTGLLVPTTHLHHLSERVDALFAMPSTQRQGMIEAARARVEIDFAPSVEAAQLDELLKRVASR